MNHLLSIWLHPRTTISEIVETNPRKFFFFLTATPSMAGNFVLLSSLASESGWDIPLLHMAIMAMGAGALVGPLLCIVTSHVSRFFFNLFHGKGSTRSMQACLAWSYVPMFPSLAFFTILTIVGPSELFQNPQLSAGGLGLPFGIWSMLYWVYNLGNFVFSIWSAGINIICISETECLSKRKTIVVSIVEAFAICAAMFLIALIIGFFVASMAP